MDYMCAALYKIAEALGAKLSLPPEPLSTLWIVDAADVLAPRLDEEMEEGEDEEIERALEGLAHAGLMIEI